MHRGAGCFQRDNPVKADNLERCLNKIQLIRYSKKRILLLYAYHLHSIIFEAAHVNSIHDLRPITPVSTLTLRNTVSHNKKFQRVVAIKLLNAAPTIP